ncbi:polysaccharide biosynthesis tyrosine autokinase [bacterium]|nr:polysaccharide biosynthesis tyrosine autokinase [bacterium]
MQNVNGTFSGLEENPVRLTDYLRILRRGKWIIILSFVAVVGSTAYFSFTTTPTYEAQCMVIVDSQSRVERTLFDVGPFSQQVTMINNQVQILKSRLLAEKVISSLLESGLQDSLSLFRVENPEDLHVGYRRYFARHLQEALSIEPVRDTDVIKIKVKAPSPQEAAFLANKVAEVYQNLDREFSRGEISQVVTFLRDQLQKKEESLRAAEEALRKFQQDEGIVALSQETQEMVKQLVEFESLYQEAVTDRKTYEKRLEYLKSQLGELRRTLETDLADISHPLILELRQKIAESEAKLVNFKAQGIPESYPDFKKENERLASLKRTLTEETKKVLLARYPVHDPLKPYQEILEKIITAETEVEALQAKEDALKKIVDQHLLKLDTLPEKSLKLARLERAKKLNENLYMMMKEKYEESRITRAGQIGKIRIVDPAVPPEFPISPKKKLNLILATLVGLGLGIGVVFFLEYLDNSVRTVEDVERLQLPLLGSIPDIEPEKQNGLWRALPKKKGSEDEVGRLATRLVTHLKPKSPYSEAYRSLRTQIQYARSEKPVQTILVSSPGPGEGKSTSVTNLAITMAQMGSKTILIDSDLRRPVLHSLFDLKRDVGLSNYLVGRAEIEEVIRPTSVDNLYLISCGILPPNPSELLGSKRMQELIQQLKNEYDYVLFDSPPLIAVTDAVVMAPWVDGVVLVLRSGKTDRDAAVRAFELLRNVKANVLGTLLNDVLPSYMYGSYYYYYYYYYYSSEDGKTKKRKKKHHHHTQLYTS